MDIKTNDRIISLLNDQGQLRAGIDDLLADALEDPSRVTPDPTAIHDYEIESLLLRHIDDGGRWTPR